MRVRIAILAAMGLALAGCTPVDRISEGRHVRRGLHRVADALARDEIGVAVHTASELVRAHPDSWDAAAGCAALFQERKSYLVALAYYERAWKVRPEPYVAQAMAICIWHPGARLERRQVAKVRAVYDAALEKWPRDPLLLNDYAYFLADLGIDTPQALEMAKRAVRLGPTNAATLDTLAWAYHRSGDQRSAYRLLERALEIDGSSRELRSHMAQVCRGLGLVKRTQVEEWKAALLSQG